MNTNMTNTTQFDVLILGGGPSGLAAGLALLKRGDLSVCLIERCDYSEHKFGESLSSGARSTLQYLAIWEELQARQALEDFNIYAAWGSPELCKKDYMFTPHGKGWSFDRQAFEKMMANLFMQRGGELRLEHQVIICERHSAGGWRVQVRNKDGEIVSLFCKYIIDASGRRGIMRTNLNLSLTVYDRLLGVGCIAQLPQHTAIQLQPQVLACEYGWWYITPMADNKVSVVLMSDPDLVNEMRASNGEVWRELLLQVSHQTLNMKECCFTDEPRSFPCFSSYLQEAGGKDWVAVGDAVATYDPISSSGIPRALASGVHAAYIAVDGIFSDGKLLETYAKVVEQDFLQYLLNQWQYYQREHRWPNARFWARRRAVLAISPHASVTALHHLDHTIKPIHLKLNEVQELWLLCQPGLTLKQIAKNFGVLFTYIPEQKIMLALQDLIESGRLEVKVEEEEDNVFFNTDRLCFN